MYVLTLALYGTSVGAYFSPSRPPAAQRLNRLHFRVGFLGAQCPWDPRAEQPLWVKSAAPRVGLCFRRTRARYRLQGVCKKEA